jgi:hypothetical protein
MVLVAWLARGSDVEFGPAGETPASSSGLCRSVFVRRGHVHEPCCLLFR